MMSVVEYNNSTKSTYTEAHKKSYLKRQESEKQRFKVYYAKNAERLKAKRRERYKLKKKNEAGSTICEQI